MYNQYLDLLSRNIDIQQKQDECEKGGDHDLIIIDHTNVCINCGIVVSDDYAQSDMKDVTTVNPLREKYSVNTYMSYTNDSRFNALKRLNTWSNYHYKEDKIVSSYDTIEEIYKHLGIYDKALMSKSKLLYNQIYIGDNIQSRRKIKLSLLIYSVVTILKNQDIECNIFDILKDYEISIQQYNDGIKKIGDDLLHEDIEMVCEKLNEYLSISLEEVVENYNSLLKQKNTFKKKCNDRTVLVGSVFNMIREKLNKKTFCEKFNITNASLNKILRNMKN